MIATEKRTDASNSSDSSSSVASQEGSERRRAPRVLVNLDVDYASTDNYLYARIQDISATGIFVRTNSPATKGTLLNLRFRIPEAARVLDVEGEVMWVNVYRPGQPDSLDPGMGIRLVDLQSDDSKLLHCLVKTFAFLDL